MECDGTSTGDNSMAIFQRLFESLSMHWCLRAVTELGLAELLVDGPAHVAELATKVQAHPRALYRILRALASEGVFTESTPLTFALTPAADLLRAAHPYTMRDRFTVGNNEPTNAEAVLHTVRTGRPMFEKVHGMEFFEWLRAHPLAAAQFSRGMEARSRAVNSGVAEAYDFSALRSVVDVGGGTGFLLSTILKKHAKVRGILFEVPHVLDQAHAVLEAAGVAGRCQLMPGNFFESVPPGADCYLLASVLHDWDDEHALQILQTVRKAAGSKGRILVVETVIPKGDAKHPGKWFDINMLVSTGGQERDEDELKALLARASLRLNLIVPTAGDASIVEAVAVDGSAGGRVGSRPQ